MAYDFCPILMKSDRIDVLERTGKQMRRDSGTEGKRSVDYGDCHWYL